MNSERHLVPQAMLFYSGSLIENELPRTAQGISLELFLAIKVAQHKPEQDLQRHMIETCSPPRFSGAKEQDERGQEVSKLFHGLVALAPNVAFCFGEKLKAYIFHLHLHIYPPSFSGLARKCTKVVKHCPAFVDPSHVTMHLSSQERKKS